MLQWGERVNELAFEQLTKIDNQKPATERETMTETNEPHRDAGELLLRTIFGEEANVMSRDDFSKKSPQERETIRSRVEEVLRSLTYREREIIKLRYAIGDGHTYTLEEVGKIFKVTRERVRQVEVKAIRRLQHPTRARKLEGFLVDPPTTPNATNNG
ncbi:MAG: sigma-70 family RNA polymerase sigma factor [Patescibacteria group bacterium]